MSHAVPTRDDERLDAVAGGRCADPFAILGRHETRVNGRPAVVVRTMQPTASQVELVTPDAVTAMERRRGAGLFEAIIPFSGALNDFAYRLRVHEGSAARELVDPYQFGQVLTDFDLHLFSEGTHYRAWEKFGSHRITVAGVAGVHFAVWAPNAQRVSVVGDFNRWDGRVHPLRRLVPSGVWEIFIPDLPDGT